MTAPLTLPGLVDTHSHVFQRALRGRSTGGDFWEWRSQMYELVQRLDPDRLLALATAAFAECVLAGITTVHEFHYLHHPHGMDDAICEAARRAGIRLVLLDVCYLRSGFDGTPLDAAQQRFSDGDVDRWMARAERVAATNPDITVGAAIHSVRAVDTRSMTRVAEWSRARQVPLHLHLSEQQAENDACVAHTGRTPTQLVHEHGVLGATTTAVHCTHVSPEDIALLGVARTAVCVCPTTERDLADGVTPASALVNAGCALRVGTDSHAVVDLFEEVRAVELDERLVTGRRGLHDPNTLLRAAAIETDDEVEIDMESVRLAGASHEDGTAMIVAAATAADVVNVRIDGRDVVRDHTHVDIDVAGALRGAIRALW